MCINIVKLSDIDNKYNQIIYLNEINIFLYYDGFVNKLIIDEDKIYR